MKFYHYSEEKKQNTEENETIQHQKENGYGAIRTQKKLSTEIDE